MTFGYAFILSTLPAFLKAVGVTLQVGFIAIGTSLLVALLNATILVFRTPYLQRLVSLYVELARNTPLLIQLYLIYYGIAQLEWVQAMWDTVWPWTMFKDPFFCAVAAFSLNTCAYTVEMLAGAIKETPAGEIEAAQAAGYGKWNMMFRLVLPSALRRTLPAYSNEVVMMLHSTSLASTVPAMMDVTAAASRIYSDFYLPFEAYLFAAGIYLVITFTLVGGFKLTERRFLAHLAPRSH